MVSPELLPSWKVLTTPSMFAINIYLEYSKNSRISDVGNARDSEMGLAVYENDFKTMPEDLLRIPNAKASVLIYLPNYLH